VAVAARSNATGSLENISLPSSTRPGAGTTMEACPSTHALHACRTPVRGTALPREAVGTTVSRRTSQTFRYLRSRETARTFHKQSGDDGIHVKNDRKPLVTDEVRQCVRWISIRPTRAGRPFASQSLRLRAVQPATLQVVLAGQPMPLSPEAAQADHQPPCERHGVRAAPPPPEPEPSCASPVPALRKPVIASTRTRIVRGNARQSDPH